MQSSSELLVMLLIVVVAVVWIYYAIRRWLTHPSPKARLPEEELEPVEAEGEVADLLRENGYRIIQDKQRIPVRITLDGEELGSRVYIDYLAEADGEIYVVKAARERMPVAYTGSGLRDRLLVYALLFEEAAGVLYVEPKERRVRRIQFEVEGGSTA